MYLLSTGPDVSSILSAVTSFVTSAVAWMGTIIGSITAAGNEILLIGFVMAIAGFGVGLFKRLVRV